jgi:hypothetical protein
MVAEQNPRVEISCPRVTKGTEADCRIVQIVPSPPVPRQVEQATATHFQSQMPQATMQSSAARPNYISQAEDNNSTPKRGTTRSQSIMKEEMLSCIDITNPPCKTSLSQLSQCKFPMTWLCKMANSVIGDNGELLE